MRYSTDDMRNYAGTPDFEFGVKFAMKEAADEIDRLRTALTTVAVNLAHQPGEAFAISAYATEQLNDPQFLTGKLWLWKHFRGGQPEYLAFNNPYPCHQSGDPMVIGEPCGFILGAVTLAKNARPEKTDDEVIAAILRSR